MTYLKHPTRGVYFLANNSVLDLTIAFLNSLRLHNPTIPLCLIPFDDAADKIERLAPVYGFQVLDRKDLFAQVDRLSRIFHGKIVGAYRKLTMWEGIFDEFIYIDVDTIVMHPLDFAFPLLEAADVVTSHSDMRALRQFVWRDSIESAGYLSPAQIRYAANTGFIASSRRVAMRGIIARSLWPAHRIRKHMALECMEQPFLNFLVITSGLRYTSLHRLRYLDRGGRLPQEFWGGSYGWFPCKGHFVVVFGRRSIQLRPGPILLVHWAGRKPHHTCGLLEWIVGRFWRGQSHLQWRWTFPCARLWWSYYTAGR